MARHLITVRMDEEMVRQLEELARVKGVTRSALIKGILKAAVDHQKVNWVKEALSALRRGGRPGKEIDWARIEQELEKTEPHFPTLASHTPGRGRGQKIEGAHRHRRLRP